MGESLPLLPTTVIGAYARPSWVFASDDWIKRGLFGPTDLRELYDDSVDRAIQDQELAGVDIITDGEMRRRGFIETFGERLTGLENVGPDRKVGETSIDMEPVLETRGKLDVPNQASGEEPPRLSRSYSRICHPTMGNTRNTRERHKPRSRGHTVSRAA